MLSECLPINDGYVAGGSSGVWVEISYKMMVIKSGAVPLKLNSPQSELYSYLLCLSLLVLPQHNIV